MNNNILIYNYIGGKIISFIDILLTSIGLAMDAFAVSICKGLAIKKISLKKCTYIAIYFGIFQALMPLLGYLLGFGFKRYIIKINKLIAFILLISIGLNMIKDIFNKDSNEKDENEKLDFKTMIILAIATSIDAMAVGITFSCLKIKILMPIVIIGLVTFLLSTMGVFIGNKFGIKYKNKAILFGGIILILMGVKILFS